MKLVIGGRAQGKLGWILGAEGLSPADVCDGGDCPPGALPDAPVLNRFHLLARRLAEAGRDPSAFALELAEKRPDLIVVSDEVGCGVVPVDPFERAWREAAGRACCLLAARSGTVVRVHAGIPGYLKGGPALQIALIRHGETPGNRARRYIGRTDEPLAPGVSPARAYPAAQRVYLSPMRRCRETAALLYPGVETVALDGLRECDFGAFEGKTYDELCGDPRYRAWLDDREGALSPPGGENTAAFRERCCRAFKAAVDGSFAEGLERIAFVVHGGTVMAVMDRFAVSDGPRGFYDWQPENLGGWTASASRGDWTARRTLSGVRRLPAKEGADG